jgi:hypothetical protein
MPLNLSKDGKWVFNRVVNDVMLYDGGELAGPAGHLGKSSASIKLVPRVTELIDGSKFQLGYDMTFEIVSEQLYSAFEFDKLRNKSGYISIPEVPLWIGTLPGGLIRFNLELDIAPGDTKGQIKIHGSKYGGKLTDLIAARWDGAVFAPWAVGDSGGIPTDVIDPNTFSYTYFLEERTPYVEYITPVAPDKDSDILEAMFALLGDLVSTEAESFESNAMAPRQTPPVNLVVEKLTGTGWTAITQASNYEVIYQGGYYYVHYDSTAALKLGDKIRITFEHETVTP